MARDAGFRVSPMTDLLSEVLDTLELESSIYFRAELSSPFSVAVPEESACIRFHVASQGQCTLTTPDGHATTFGPGDLVMVPHGLAHVLSDVPGRPSEPLPRVLDASGFDGVGPLVFGGDGAQTTLVCGHFAFSPIATHPFIASLPTVLHLRRGDGAGYAWVERLLASTEEEARLRSTGWESIVKRLSQILFVYVLRAYMEKDAEALGALSALADPQLSRALESVHASPQNGWSVESLAERAQMSRSAFIRRFRQTCGMAPMRYVTHWRMQRARSLLAHSDVAANEVAGLVGYASEAAFNRAFKEHCGAPPATYRRRARTPEGAP